MNGLSEVGTIDIYEPLGRELVDAPNSMVFESRFAWFDLRNVKQTEVVEGLIAILEDLDSCGVVIDEEFSGQIPSSLKKVGFVNEVNPNVDYLCQRFDIIVLRPETVLSEWYLLNKTNFTKPVGAMVNVLDMETLRLAVELTRYVSLVVVQFKDETKIPLEIVLADAQNNGCCIVMHTLDADETKLVFGVLECGASGVLVEANDISKVLSVYEEVRLSKQTINQELVELSVVRTFYAGMGDRACVDLTSELGLGEGILVGSFSNGGVLACSETHPLPYMKTRPFRINAGALHSYVLAPDEQTWYLSDLRAGMEVLAINTNGQARPVTVGRVKMERRPILCIEAKDPSNNMINVFMQADWHVRVFGSDGLPKNITTLKAGDRILGFTMEAGRHVGVKVNEKISEQ
ncbi:MAG: 3-dehydroquinate synthase II [Ignavibacteriales bacterium]